MSAKLLLPTLFACLAITNAASAAPQPQKTFDYNLTDLAEVRPGAVECFHRAYDPAHMSQHPRQTVKALALCVTVKHWAEDGAGRYEYNFRLRVRQKGEPKVLEARGECGYNSQTDPLPRDPARHLGCWLECDGGGISVKRDNANGDLIINLERIRMSRGCSEGDEVELRGGADDRVFRLNKVPRDKAKI